MPVIQGNGRDVISINGRQVAYQGIGHVRKEMATETAVEKTKGNGLDEYYLNVEDEKGQTQRVIVYGDHLDFSFRSKKTEPTVMVNGKAAKLVAFEDEQTTFWQGMIQGAKRGIIDAFESLGDLGKRIMGGVAAAGALTLAGGTALMVMSKLGMVGGAGFSAVIGSLAGPISYGTLTVAAAGIGIIALAGAVKGGAAALTNKPHMETIAAVTQEAVQFNPQKPGAANQNPTPVTPAPQQPAPQKPQRPEPPSSDSSLLMQPVPPQDPFKLGKSL